jgi:hypothetical protein
MSQRTGIILGRGIGSRQWAEKVGSHDEDPAEWRKVAAVHRPPGMTGQFEYVGKGGDAHNCVDGKEIDGKKIVFLSLFCVP